MNDRRNRIRLIGFDGDDTLWHNEQRFQDVQSAVRIAVQRHGVDEVRFDERLLEVQRHTVPLYGYGAKSLCLSIVETIVDLCGDQPTHDEIRYVLGALRDLLAHPPKVIDGALDVVRQMRSCCRVMLITKGDRVEQQAKVEALGLQSFFDEIHIVSEKNPETYRELLAGSGTCAADFAMVGNSLRSDILPALQIGAVGIHVPYHVTWAYELVEPPSTAKFHSIAHLDQLQSVLQREYDFGA
jgi:putative hydrolase of the HAD superfamily